MSFKNNIKIKTQLNKNSAFENGISNLEKSSKVIILVKITHARQDSSHKQACVNAGKFDIFKTQRVVVIEKMIKPAAITGCAGSFRALRQIF